MGYTKLIGIIEESYQNWTHTKTVNLKAVHGEDTYPIITIYKGTDKLIENSTNYS